MPLNKQQDKIETTIRGGCTSGKPLRWAVVRADEANDGFYNMGLGLLLPFNGWHATAQKPTWMYDNILTQPIGAGLQLSMDDEPEWRLLLWGGIYSLGLIVEDFVGFEPAPCWPELFFPPPLRTFIGGETDALPNGVEVHWYRTADSALFHHPECYLPTWRDTDGFLGGLDDLWELLL